MACQQDHILLPLTPLIHEFPKLVMVAVDFEKCIALHKFPNQQLHQYRLPEKPIQSKRQTQLVGRRIWYFDQKKRGYFCAQYHENGDELAGGKKYYRCATALFQRIFQASKSRISDWHRIVMVLPSGENVMNVLI